METSAQNRLIEGLNQIQDFRVNRTKLYPLNEILFLCVNAALSGCRNWVQVADFGNYKVGALRKYLPYENGTPSHDTIRRVMNGISPEAFEVVFLRWAGDFMPPSDQIGIDGKTICGSAQKSAGIKALHLVNAFATDTGICLGQIKTEDKSNEITAIPLLLDALEIEGRVVTLDAMGTQTRIAELILQKGGDYILALKGNHENLFDEANELPYKSRPIARFEEPWQKDHGRIERRICSVFDAGLLTHAEVFAGVQSLVRVEAERRILAKDEVVDIQRSTRWYISSAAFPAEEFCRRIRAHWLIENGLHWMLDVAFREDDSQVKSKVAAQNFALVNKFALNLLKKDDRKKSVEAKIKIAAISDEYRDQLLQN